MNPRASRIELDLPPATPAQRLLCAEFAEWCDRHGFDRPADDNPMLLNLLDRRQRQFLWNFIARWDWATEDAATAPGALRTPLELAGIFVEVVREHCSRGEFRSIMAGECAVDQVLHVDSAIDLAFARAHRVPVDGAKDAQRFIAEKNLKVAALRIADQAFQIRSGS